jgi:signal transduction histidine kinase
MIRYLRRIKISSLKVTALTSFYLLLVLTLSIAAISVVRTSRSGISDYNHITEKAIHISNMLLNFRQEADEIQAATVRMIFNTEEEDVNGERERITLIHQHYANNWSDCLKWMTELGQKELYDTLMYYKTVDSVVRRQLLYLSKTGNSSNQQAVEFYYNTQHFAYDDYQQFIQKISTQISSQIQQQMYETNAAVTIGSDKVNFWLFLSFVIMVVGGILIVRDHNKLIRVQKQLLDEREQRFAEITKQTLNAQERERNELGKELHDNVNQLLTVAKLNLSIVLDKPEKCQELVPKSMDHLKNAIEEIRYLCKSLVSPLANNISLHGALEELVCNMQHVRESTKFTLTMINIKEESISSPIKLTLYRIVQEQLNNILKHADASAASIHVTVKSDQLILMIRDNGKGFNPAQNRKGVGVSNIINRAEAYEGNAIFESAPGQGCTLTVVLPFHQVKSMRPHLLGHVASIFM